MKYKSLHGKIFTGFLFVILMTACSKTTTQPGNNNNNFGQENNQTGPEILYLETDHWQQLGPQVYVNTFSGIMKNQTGDMQVYLETANREILISAGEAGLTGGEIWCQAVGTDLQIIYRDFSQQSPGTMNIKVVFS
jgi:hypothetical protein